jgi:hypothetical protein
MPATAPQGAATKDPQAAELAALTDAVGAISKRLDALMRGRKNGASDSNGNGDGSVDDTANTGETAVNTGETSEEEKGHATEGGEDTRARQLASDSAGRADSQRKRRREEVEADETLRAEAQYRFDSVFMAVTGERCPPSMVTEESRPFRERMLNRLKKYSPEHKNLDLSRCDDATFDLLDRQICKTAMEVSTDPQRMSEIVGTPGDLLREIKRRDRTGRDRSEFYGPIGAPNGVLAQFRMPTFRVRRINTRPDQYQY